MICEQSIREAKSVRRRMKRNRHERRTA
jgi:hypothetical protein